MNEINHANIIFMPTISALGGIETYVYELVKKYHDRDIAVVSNSCDEKQAKRIRKYCKLYIHHGEKINCKVAIINYDQSIIKYICDDAKIYQTIHADYTNPIYNHKPQPHPRVTAFIAITQFLQDKMKDILEPNEVMLSYNPLTVDDEKPIILVSATRLHKHKGKDRMQKLATALDNAGVNYIWYVITGDVGGIDSPNVIFIQNRLDITKWLSQATYVVLLSDSEACSYTLNEALYRNIPIITTPLPYLEEIGVRDGENGYIMDFDCSNVDNIVENITKIPKFTFKRLDDKYGELFTKDKSHYDQDQNQLVQVQVLKTYHDIELNRVVESGEIIKEPMKLSRAEHLEFKGLVRIIANIKD